MFDRTRVTSMKKNSTGEKNSISKRFCNEKSKVELIERTNNRDKIHQSWVDSQAHRQYKYYVISDCHSPSFQINQLANYFKSTPELNTLQDTYQTLSRYSISWAAILSCHPDITFILIGSWNISQHGTLQLELKRTTFIIWRKKAGGKLVQDLGWETISLGLFSRDTLEYAIN